MSANRFRFIPRIDFLSRRVVLSADAPSAVIAPDASDIGPADSSMDGPAIDAALDDLSDGSSGDDDPGPDPMAPQLPDDMEYTTATPVLACPAYP